MENGFIGGDTDCSKGLLGDGDIPRVDASSATRGLESLGGSSAPSEAQPLKSVDSTQEEVLKCRIAAAAVDEIAELGEGLEAALKREMELNRVNQLKDHFIAILAHELRNPLAPMLNAVELLRTQDPGDAIDVIERQVNHMARMLDDLLDISRIASGKIILRKSRIDLVSTVRAAARLARSTFATRNQRFQAVFPDEPLWMDADPLRIEQVVGNLLSNAAKYTGDGEGKKQILLTLEREGKEAMIRVKDQGIGIAPEMRECIFEPFVQLESAREHAGGGLGLGLSLVRRLVAMHGGNVAVTSEGPGKGAEFSVRLPLMEVPDTVAESVDRERPGHQCASQTPKLQPSAIHRILVVDDNPDLTGTLARLLTSWGHRVKVVNTGADALKQALEFRPDVALVDIGLPGTDGYSVARQLCTAQGLPGIQIIAMTGYGQEGDRSRASESGFSDYLLKPVDPVALRERLRK